MTSKLFYGKLLRNKKENFFYEIEKDKNKEIKDLSKKNRKIIMKLKRKNLQLEGEIFKE